MEWAPVGIAELKYVFYVKRGFKYHLQNVNSILYPAMQLGKQIKEKLLPDISPLIPIYCHPDLSDGGITNP